MSSVYTLTDFPPVYLIDPKVHWEPFKKAVKDCAVAWNFKNWLNTVIYQSEAYSKVVAAKGGEMKLKKENVVDKDGEAKAQEPPVMTPEVRKALGYGESIFEYFQSDVVFVDVVSEMIET